MKPYYADDFVEIIHGDWREYAESLELGFQSADCIIADPPYGETALKWDRWPEGWPKVAEGIAPTMWCFGSFKMFMEKRGEFGNWLLAQDIVWEKHNGSGFAADRFKRVHEYAVQWYRGSWDALYKDVPKVDYAGASKSVRKRGATPHTGKIGDTGYVDDGTRLMRSVLQVRSCQGFAENETQKPEGIVRPLIEYSCPPRGKVASLFMGSGTDLVVAKQLGRRAIGFDIREDQCEIAARRVSQELALGA